MDSALKNKIQVLTKLKKEKFLLDLTSRSITRIIFIGFSFFANVLIARWLLPEGKGVITSVLVIITMSSTISTLGVRQSLAYYKGKGKAKDEDLFAAIFFIWVICASIAVFLSLSLLYFQGLTKHGVLIITTALVILPFDILCAYIKGIWTGRKWITKLNIADLCRITAHFALILILVGVAKLGLIGAFIALLGAYSTEFGYIISQETGLFGYRFKSEFQLIKSLIRKGVGYAAALIIFQMNYRVDIIILGHYVEASEIGLYSIGVSMAELIWQLPSILGFVVFSYSAATQDATDFSHKVWMTVKKILPLCCLGGCLISLLAPKLIPFLYGEVFRPSVPVLWMLMPGIVLSVAFKILHSDMAGRGKPLLAVRIFSSALVCNIVLNLLLIPRYGIIGAAFASTITYSSSSIVFIYKYLNEIKKKSG